MCKLKRSPSSMTAPTTSSSSRGRWLSRSCSIDVLCVPAFSAPAMRCSIEMGSSMPNRRATASTSVIRLRISGPVFGSRTISASVAPVSALTGLSEALPSSLTQISWRMRVVIGARRPPAISASAICRQRSERLPSGSPSVRRLPSTWRITPGPSSVVAK